MESVHHVISIFICLVSFLSGLFLCLRKDKSFSHLMLGITLILAGVLFTTDITYLSSNVNYVRLVHANIISRFFTPAIPVFIGLYAATSTRKKIFSLASLIYYLPGLAIGMGTVVIYFVMGIDNATGYLAAIDAKDTSAFTSPLYKLHDIWVNNIYFLVLLIEMLSYYVLCIQFFIKNPGEDTSNIKANMVLVALFAVRILMGREYLMEHLWISVGMYVLILIAGGTVIVKGAKPLSFLHPESRCIQLGEQDRFDTLELSEMSITELMYFNKLTQLENYLRERKAEGKKKVSVDEAAKALSMSRQTIQMLIATEYGCTFKQFVCSNFC